MSKNTSDRVEGILSSIYVASEKERWQVEIAFTLGVATRLYLPKEGTVAEVVAALKEWPGELVKADEEFRRLEKLEYVARQAGYAGQPLGQLLANLTRAKEVYVLTRAWEQGRAAAEEERSA